MAEYVVHWVRKAPLGWAIRDLHKKPGTDETRETLRWASRALAQAAADALNDQPEGSEQPK